MPSWPQQLVNLLHPARSMVRVQRSAEQQRAVDEAAGNLTLYHFRSCPYCLKVRRAIDWLNVDITLRDIRQDETACTELISGGGRQMVPCLRIDDGDRIVWLYESADIIRYLEKRFAPVRAAS